MRPEAVAKQGATALVDAHGLGPVAQHGVNRHQTRQGVERGLPAFRWLGAEEPRCRFLKLEDEPSPVKIGQLLSTNPGLVVFGGLGGNMFLEELKRGAVGTMTGFGFPEILVRIYRAFAAGRLDEATEIFYRYCPLIRFENQPRINLPIRKHIYHLRGALASPRGRFPIPELDKDMLADLDDLLVRLGLVESPAAPPAR